MSDLLTLERTQQEVHEIADSWRQLFGVDAAPKVNILWCVEAQLPSLFPQFALVVRDDVDLPIGPAVTEYDPPRIELRARYYRGVRQEHPLARFALAHELGHLVLHPQEMPKFLKDGVQERYRLQRMSIEHQADEFALFFLVAEHIARKVGDIAGIVDTCGVPYELALKACRLYGIRTRKLLPYEVASLLTAEEEDF